MAEIKTSHFFVSIIVPLYNDADIIEAFYKELHAVVTSHYENYEIVFIDDWSTDETPAIINKLLQQQECLRYIRLSRKFGTEIAISAGLDTVIGDVIIIIQPETDPPEIIPEMVAEVKAINGVVYGIQKNRNKYLTIHYRIGKWIFYNISRRFLEYYPPENAGYFFGLSRLALNAIIQIKDKSKFLRIFSSRIGFNHKIIRYDITLRRKHMRRRSFSKSARYGIDALTTNSTLPLRYVSYIGFISALFNVLYIGYIFIVALFKENVVEGWITSSLQRALMFMTVAAMFSVFAEYLARLIDESKDQPAYYIYEAKNSSVMISDEELRRNVMKDSKK